MIDTVIAQLNSSWFVAAFLVSFAWWCAWQIKNQYMFVTDKKGNTHIKCRPSKDAKDPYQSIGVGPIEMAASNTLWEFVVVFVNATNYSPSKYKTSLRLLNPIDTSMFLTEKEMEWFPTKDIAFKYVLQEATRLKMYGMETGLTKSFKDYLDSINMYSDFAEEFSKVQTSHKDMLT